MARSPSSGVADMFHRPLLHFKQIAILGLIVSMALLSDTVDKNKFKKCDQSGFCKRQRGMPEGDAQYVVKLDSAVTSDPSQVEFPVTNEKNGIQFKLTIVALEDETFRIQMNDANPLHPRYVVEHALVPNLSRGKVEVQKSSDSWTLKSGSGEVRVHANPMYLEVYSAGEKVIVINGRQTLKFEHLRTKPDVNDEIHEEGEVNDNEVKKHENEEPSMWEESFSGNTDSKPRGPESIGVDIDFPLSHHLYGIPEHADDFALRNTGSIEPYRLYNLDVFEYELNSPMALYGSIPYVVAHSTKRTVGMLWLNGAETWVDVEVGPDGLMDSIVNLVGGGAEDKGGKSRWMSESGIIDITVFLGPKPHDVFRQYGKVTGTTPLPQKWAIAYHQCRWNYNDQDDVKMVDESFDTYDIPYDSLWLDIEHTDGKKYFTWDAHKFPNSIEMINSISAKGRKMVTIIDPHIKRDSGYFVHEEALSNDLYVKDKHGKVYEGWCWPGSSSYLDFFDPKVRSYWASKFNLDKYVGSTLDLYTWNDMNEPSVFNGPEITMPKDMMHYGNWEHRQVHNLYGLMQVISTFEGHLERSEGRLRPFILTRAHFVGTQRYAAVWTGDNTADWGHLKASIPMCLTLSVSGVAHCGADVGGFFGNPEPELLLRWYQAGAFQPFFRAHAHIETKRREPWLFGDHMTALIRSAIRKRYALLPYWYTLFYQTELTSIPPMRPLWAEYPEDVQTFNIQDQHLIGDALLVHPVTDKGASSVNVYFPKGIWYDFYKHQAYAGGSHSISVTEETIPVFQRGGSIIPTKQRVRRASSLMRSDPYTLYVAVDQNGFANGTLYIDDEETYEYRKGKNLLINFEYKNNELRATVKNSGGFKTTEWVERIVIVGLTYKPSNCQITSHSVGTTKLEFESFNPLVIRKPAVLVSEDWTLTLTP